VILISSASSDKYINGARGEFVGFRGSPDKDLILIPRRGDCCLLFSHDCPPKVAGMRRGLSGPMRIEREVRSLNGESDKRK
jgi:hypothetical protein